MIKYMNEFLEMGHGEICLGFFYMGHYDGEIPDQTRGPIAEKVVWME